MSVLGPDDAERAIGKVFAGTTNASRAELDLRLGRGERPVAEVEYLYATEDDQLFQPVFLRLRDDKEPDECTLDQLVRTSRDVVALSAPKPAPKPARKAGKKRSRPDARG
jgi:ATP-dependent DNA ligase